MNCTHCGHALEDSSTTFTVVRSRQVYVVENVPCLECPICGHITFSQDVAKRLETYTSGRVVPSDTSYKVLVYRWDAPMVEIKESPTEGYFSPTLNVPGTVTYPISLS